MAIVLNLNLNYLFNLVQSKSINRIQKEVGVYIIYVCSVYIYI